MKSIPVFAIALLLAFGGVATAAGPGGTSAPGAVAFALNVATKPQLSRDAPAAPSAAIALPDGSVMMASTSTNGTLALAKVDRDGSLNSAFGTNGISQIRRSGFAAGSVSQLLLLPSGEFVIVGQSVSVNTQLLLVEVTATGALDRSFGHNGELTVNAVQATCECTSQVAALPNGEIAVAGTQGSGMALALYSSAGLLQTGFGSAGVAEFGGSGSTPLAVVATSSGEIVIAIAEQIGAKFDDALMRVTSAGAQDTTFGGAQPVLLPFSGGVGVALAITATRAVDVVPAVPESGGPIEIVQYTPSGALDTSYGSGGLVPLPTSVDDNFAEGGAYFFVSASGALLAWPLHLGGQGYGTLDVFGVNAGGVAVGAEPVALSSPVAGGEGLGDSDFVPGAVVQRPDGSVVEVGGASINSTHDTYSSPQWVALSFDAALETDPLFGATTPLTVIPRLVQRPVHSTAKSVIVDVDASAPADAEILVTLGQRVLAVGTNPLLLAGPQGVAVDLTRFGRARLRSLRVGHVTVKVVARDVLGDFAHVSALTSLH